MDMIIKKNIGRWCRLLAVGIFWGMTSCQAAAETEIDLNGNEIIDESNTETETFLHHIKKYDYIFTNETSYESDTKNEVALKISGKNNVITQSGDIYLSGKKAVCVEIEGTDNMLIIPLGTTVNSVGVKGKGIVVSSGQNHVVKIIGTLSASGNAIEVTNDSAVANIDLFGTLQGNNVIYIAKKAEVSEINIESDAEISGNIFSVSDKTTNVNVNSDFNYDGNFSGAGNINLNVNSGKMNYGGTAKIVNVTISKNASLFGGKFTVDTFTNHGTIGAGSGETNLIINGDLISDGVLKKISGGSNGVIVVTGTANVEGSTVTTDSLLPNETTTVLIADKVTGNIVNTTDNPVKISAMLTATGEIMGNTIKVTTHEIECIEELNQQEAETYDAMKNMFGNLQDETQQNEMRTFYNLEKSEAKETLTQISSNDAAQIMSVAQQSTVADKMIANRITRVFSMNIPEYMDVVVNPMHLADGESDTPEVKVKVKVPTSQDNNLWINYMKNWGTLRGGTDYHGNAMVMGYDKSFGRKWRGGVFATYGSISYGADSSRATVYDTRFGIYAGYHNRASDLYLYVNGGQLRNSLNRGLYSLGLSTNAKYKSHIAEIGGEYKYDLQPRRKWHVSPFINFQASYLKQDAYNESGAGIYNQHVEADSNTYFAAQVGLDIKRYYKTGMFGLRFGVKHGFTGADPDLNISYEGDGTRVYNLRQKRDKTHFVFSLRGENEFARGWFVGGEAELQLGNHDKDVTASVMLRRTW
ncbi:MAG: autotransporter domain-containing protein [Selenomonadaceae bacterium]|nr:autotransporter domain-containing protein [Selenomonadaceae bacterium]